MVLENPVLTVWLTAPSELLARTETLPPRVKPSMPTSATSPGADKNCTGHCPFRTVCRVNHARALEKTWEPPSAT